jgi:adenine deaminase
MTDTVRFTRTLRPEDFQVRAKSDDGPVKVRVIGVSKTDLVTSEFFEMLDVVDGVIRPDPGKDVAMTAMIDRLGKGSGKSVAFIKGFRLTAGAIASTHNAVCENLAIVGTNGADMAFAAQRAAAPARWPNRGARRKDPGCVPDAHPRIVFGSILRRGVGTSTRNPGGG